MVGNEVVIRKAREADFEFILEANAAVSEKGSNTVLRNAERLKKDLFGKTARAAVIIAEVEGQAVGMTLYATTYFANEGELMWVSQMYVEPRFRNRKQWIAPALMSELIKIAQEMGLYLLGNRHRQQHSQETFPEAWCACLGKFCHVCFAA